MKMHANELLDPDIGVTIDVLLGLPKLLRLISVPEAQNTLTNQRHIIYVAKLSYAALEKLPYLRLHILLDPAPGPTLLPALHRLQP